MTKVTKAVLQRRVDALLAMNERQAKLIAKLEEKKPRSISIWYNSDDDIQWVARKVKPSEIAFMGLILQEAALKMMGECEIDNKEP